MRELNGAVIDDTVRNVRHETGYDQSPQLFLNEGGSKFRDVAREVGQARP